MRPACLAAMELQGESRPEREPRTRSVKEDESPLFEEEDECADA